MNSSVAGLDQIMCSRHSINVLIKKALISLNIEAYQTCQRTAKLSMDGLLLNGIHEKLKIC